MSPCTRRRLLRRSGLTLSLAFAGCTGERQRRTATTDATASMTATSEPTTATPTTSEPTPTESTTAEPTTTPLPSAEVRYQFGEWHLDEPWKLTVAEIELSRTFRTDDGGTYEMPDDEQLLVVTTRVENVDGSRHHYSGAFDGLIDGQVYEDDMGFPHPDFERGVRTKDLAAVEHIRRWAPHALPVDPGENATSWLAWVVPDDVERSNVRIGYDPNHDGTYPIRWHPA